MPTVILIHRLIPEPEKLLDMGVSLLLTVAAAFLLWQLAYLIVGRVEKWIGRAAGRAEGGEQRARTLGSIFRNLAVVLIVSGALVHALAVLGWDIRPLLAGAGILGVALGFGAQTLVRDVIAGFFILVENQFSVGDVIEVNGQAAKVEGLTVRCTCLRDFNGYVHFVPNGEMKVVVNRSRVLPARLHLRSSDPVRSLKLILGRVQRPAGLPNLIEFENGLNLLRALGRLDEDETENLTT